MRLWPQPSVDDSEVSLKKTNRPSRKNQLSRKEIPYFLHLVFDSTIEAA
jgi:hypothetical protein